MFQRFKAVIDSIDSGIAEEQGRQRATQSPTRSSSRRNTNTRRRQASTDPTSSSLARPLALKESDSAGGSESGGEKSAPPRNPDPAEFDADFVVGDDDTPSRAGTPVAARETTASPAPDGDAKDKEATATAGNDEEGKETEAKPSAQAELPYDVRVKLRKLERIESRHSDLVRSYRIAHARVGTIDAFEATLREHTPLTSINDPGAFIEYINQISTKGDMVMEEFKRVSAEKDSLKKRLDDAEQKATEARAELQRMRDGFSSATSTSSATAEPQSDKPGDITSPVSATSARSAATMSEQPDLQSKDDEGEDFFSYDSELPRLQTELQNREERVAELETENGTLKTDLAVAKESAEHMVQDLETATRRQQELQDSKDKLRSELSDRFKSLETESDELKAKLQAAENDLERAGSSRSEREEIISDLEAKLKAANQDLEDLRSAGSDAKTPEADATEAQQKVEQLEKELAEARSASTRTEKRSQTLDGLVQALRTQVKNAGEEIADLNSRLDESTADVRRLQQEAASAKLKELVSDPGTKTVPADSAKTETGTSGKKKNKKKKKGGRPGAASTEQKEPEGPSAANGADEPDADPSQDQWNEQEQLAVLRKTAAAIDGELRSRQDEIERLKEKLKDQDDLAEEIESLRDELINVGQEHVEAKDKINELRAERDALQENMRELEKEMSELRVSQASSASDAEQQMALASEFEELKSKADSLQTDLSVAQQLAATRFKDMTDLRETLQKTQPELASLRTEVADLRKSKEELSVKASEVRKLEVREKELSAEVTTAKSNTAAREKEIQALNERVTQDYNQRLSLEDANRKVQRDVQRTEAERKEAVETKDRLFQELTVAQDELKSSRARLQELEQQATKLNGDTEGLRDELTLKTAQYASAQSLMNSMQDQTQELGAQMKEVRERCENLEEELTNAHQLLRERSREGETMRRLLADVEGRAEARVKEMRERMELAVEERDRAEDQANTIGRRRTRELEEVKQRVRDAERGLKRAVEEKDDLAAAEAQLRRQKEELERRAATAGEEVAEVRQAMSQLRDALDEGEKQARDLEQDKAELRKTLEETQQRLEKVQKSSKSMADELRTLQTTAKARPHEPTIVMSTRSSLESSPTRGPAASPAIPRLRSPSVGGPEASKSASSSGQMDYVYLKNVLLQFLEQKDKKHQIQLVPVLGMLLHFDRKDEQKWMAAITTK